MPAPSAKSPRPQRPADALFPSRLHLPSAARSHARCPRDETPANLCAVALHAIFVLSDSLSYSLQTRSGGASTPSPILDYSQNRYILATDFPHSPVHSNPAGCAAFFPMPPHAAKPPLPRDSHQSIRPAPSTPDILPAACNAENRATSAFQIRDECPTRSEERRVGKECRS